MGVRFKMPLLTLFEVQRNVPIAFEVKPKTWYAIFSELEFANDFVERANIKARVQTLHTVGEIVHVFDTLLKGGEAFTDFEFFIDPVSIAGDEIRTMPRNDFLQPFRDAATVPPTIGPQ